MFSGFTLNKGYPRYPDKLIMPQLPFIFEPSFSFFNKKMIIIK
jgi:hypothetical protein